MASSWGLGAAWAGRTASASSSGSAAASADARAVTIVPAGAGATARPCWGCTYRVGAFTSDAAPSVDAVVDVLVVL